jgi:hypothetical protein
LHSTARVRAAIPLFGEEISPRFCYARQALILDWEGDSVRRRTLARLGSTAYPERLEILARRGATLLICGAFPRDQLDEAARLGIRVVCGAAGAVPHSDGDLAALLATYAMQKPVLRPDPTHIV